MRAPYRSKLRKGPKRTRPTTVHVNAYCRRKGLRRGRSGRNQRGEVMPF